MNQICDHTWNININNCNIKLFVVTVYLHSCSGGENDSAGKGKYIEL